MPFKIDRALTGLLQLLATRGGLTPAELEDRIQGVIELTQMYGLQQQRLSFTNNAALAPLGTVDITNAGLGVSYALLFGANVVCVQTATATALRASVHLLRSGSGGLPVATGEARLFGAAFAGPFKIPFWAPYPILLVPPWTVRGFLDALGTDPTANVTIQAELGILS